MSRRKSHYRNKPKPGNKIKVAELKNGFNQSHPNPENILSGEITIYNIERIEIGNAPSSEWTKVDSSAPALNQSNIIVSAVDKAFHHNPWMLLAVLCVLTLLVYGIVLLLREI